MYASDDYGDIKHHMRVTPNFFSNLLHVACICLITLMPIKLLSSISEHSKGAYSQWLNTNLQHDEYDRWNILRIMAISI